VDVLTTGNPHPWWEILVPEEHVPRATELLAQEKARMDASADANAQAAEEEELENEAATSASGTTR
jgi:hypothetical protein